MQRTSSVGIAIDAHLVRHRSRDLPGPVRLSSARNSFSHPLRSLKAEYSSPLFFRFLLAALAIIILILRPWTAITFTFGKGNLIAWTKRVKVPSAGAANDPSIQDEDFHGRRRSLSDEAIGHCNRTSCKSLSNAASGSIDGGKRKG